MALWFLSKFPHYRGSRMAKKFIIALDLGTTGNRVFCFDEAGYPISSAYTSSPAFPAAGMGRARSRGNMGSIAALTPKHRQGASILPSLTIGSRTSANHRPLEQDTRKPYNAIVCSVANNRYL